MRDYYDARADEVIGSDRVFGAEFAAAGRGPDEPVLSGTWFVAERVVLQ